jgi:hypothetical protein
MPINTLNDSPAVIPINISNPTPDNHAVSMRNFQEASIEITAETSRNSTRSLPKHHLNTTIDELTSGKLEPIATSSPINRDNSRSTVHYSRTNSNTTNQSETTRKTDNLTILTINFQSITNKGTELCNIISSSSPEIIIGTKHTWTQHITMPKYYRMTYQVATSIKYTGKTGKNSLTKTMEVYSLW